MRQRSAVFALTMCFALAAAVPGGSAENSALPLYRVLVGGRMIDGTGAEPVEDSVLVINDGRILAAGPRETTEIPFRSTVLDVSGMTVLPGFFNAHVHRGLNTANLEAWARAGVTTVRDLGSLSSRRISLLSSGSSATSCGRRSALSGWSGTGWGR